MLLSHRTIEMCAKPKFDNTFNTGHLIQAALFVLTTGGMVISFLVTTAHADRQTTENSLNIKDHSGRIQRLEIQNATHLEKLINIENGIKELNRKTSH